MSARPKCPGYCSHYADEHTAAGGCMHRRTDRPGVACGCTWTSGISAETGTAQGANPFAAVRITPPA